MKGTGTKNFEQLPQGGGYIFFLFFGHFGLSQAELFWMRRKWKGKKILTRIMEMDIFRPSIFFEFLNFKNQFRKNEAKIVIPPITSPHP